MRKKMEMTSGCVVAVLIIAIWMIAIVESKMQTVAGYIGAWLSILLYAGISYVIYESIWLPSIIVVISYIFSLIGMPEKMVPLLITGVAIQATISIAKIWIVKT